MLFQGTSDPLLFLLWVLIGTIIVTLILYLSTMLIISTRKAKDKVVLIVIEALIVVLILPIIIGAIESALGAIGEAIAAIRNVLDDGGNAGFLPRLAIIFGFLILLAMTKFFIDTTWSSALWISILTLAVLYILFTVFPELYGFLGIGL